MSTQLNVPDSKFKQVTGRFLAIELLWAGLIAPFLLFPGPLAPWWFLALLFPRLIQFYHQRKLFKPSVLNWSASLILIMAFVSYSVSVDQALSWARLWGITLQVVVFWSVANGIASRQQLSQMHTVVLIVTLSVTLLGFFGTDWDSVRLIAMPEVYDLIPQLVSGLPGSGLPGHGPFFSPREVGMTMAFLFPYPFISIWLAPDAFRRWLAGTMAVVMLVLLILSQAITGLLGLFAGLVVVGWVYRRRLTMILMGSGVAILTGFLLLPGTIHTWVQAALNIDHPLGVALVLRLDMWSRALAMIRDMPLSGIGLNTFPIIQSHFYPGYLIGPEVHAHNLPLQIALDLGLPGLFAWSWLIVAFFLVSYRLIRSTTDTQIHMLLVANAAAVAAYLATGTLDIVTLGAKPTVAVWAFIGLTVAIGHLERSVPTSQSLRRASLLAAGSGLGLMLGLLLIFPGILPRNLGSVMAHQALFQARMYRMMNEPQIAAAISSLEETLVADPKQAQVQGTLASLYAWSGRLEQVQQALVKRVELDGPDALNRYAPFIRWQGQIGGMKQQEEAPSIIKLYRQWNNRYPDRAEYYLLLAVATDAYVDGHSGDNYILEGVASHAVPVEIFEPWLAVNKDD